MALDSYNSKPDFEDLARRLVALEDEAYQHFADFFSPALLRFFLKKGLSVSDAEDLAATCIGDVAMKVHSKYRPQEGGSFQAWVYQIARRKVADWYRKKKRQNEVFVSLPSLAGADDEAQEWQHDTMASLAVQSALSDLNELDREILEHRLFSNNPNFQEIGDALGIEEAAARQRYHRAAKRIAKVLEKDRRLEKYHHKERRTA